MRAERVSAVRLRPLVAGQRALSLQGPVGGVPRAVELAGPGSPRAPICPISARRTRAINSRSACGSGCRCRSPKSSGRQSSRICHDAAPPRARRGADVAPRSCRRRRRPGRPQAALDGLAASLRSALDVPHVYLVSSGRAALTLILRALGRLSPRRHVILPAYTCFSAPAAVGRAGLTVTALRHRPPDARLRLRRAGETRRHQPAAVRRLDPPVRIPG